MRLEQIPAGYHIPDEINAVIEIPAHSDPIKYELDKSSGAMFVDRFLGTSMVYPCNYGFIPNTLAEDGDPLDVLVLTPLSLPIGVVIRCRPLGLLNMQDDAGQDEKIIAVPVDKVCPAYATMRTLDDIAPSLLQQIKHFFEHYKDLETGKWVKVEGWGDQATARCVISNSVARYRAEK